MLYFNVGFNLIQCVVITVGEWGFSIEEVYDFATFKDTNSDSGMKLILISWQDRHTDRQTETEERER